MIMVVWLTALALALGVVGLAHSSSPRDYYCSNLPVRAVPEKLLRTITRIVILSTR